MSEKLVMIGRDLFLRRQLDNLFGDAEVAYSQVPYTRHTHRWPEPWGVVITLVFAVLGCLWWWLPS